MCKTQHAKPRYKPVMIYLFMYHVRVNPYLLFCCVGVMVIGVIQVGLMFLRWCSFLWVLMFSFMISSIVHRIVVVVGGVFFGIWWVGVCLVFWLILLIMFFSVGYMVFHIFVWGWLSVGVPSIWALHHCIGVVCILCSPFCWGLGLCYSFRAIAALAQNTAVSSCVCASDCSRLGGVRFLIW